VLPLPAPSKQLLVSSSASSSSSSRFIGGKQCSSPAGTQKLTEHTRLLARCHLCLLILAAPWLCAVWPRAQWDCSSLHALKCNHVWHQVARCWWQL
jgi:hypothetical protein